MIALCESGHAVASGQRCPNAADLLIEVMPAQNRASHVTAGNCGSYPHNGALRLLVCEGCAELLEASEGEWFARLEREAGEL
ncbi:MAG TPA: hypothetical protein VHW01_14775 [Polyangiaceae bacterium]|jgi:hypothetical protein|nr:hypothetical protein [Polyangiaceae bacterium]